ncbi:ATP-binding protein [Streptomyces roseicoloratus]|uniref:ATP-binding protein n=1 Tax=Streptomyces roseicoloratus TaxID=2508722 RepID=UPI0013E98E0A|nr:ATP-binding protein [Streptomyces roseicoloratus]
MSATTTGLFSFTEHSGTPDENAPTGDRPASRSWMRAEAPVGTGERGTPASRRDRAVCSMRTSPEAVPALRSFAKVMARRWGIGEDAVYTLRVTVSELVTNAVLHSGGDQVELFLGFDGVTAVVQVRDGGTWVPPEPATEDRQDEVHGRGLNIVRAYARTCTVESSWKGTEVRAEIDVSATGSQPFAFDAALIAEAAA